MQLGLTHPAHQRAFPKMPSPLALDIELISSCPILPPKTQDLPCIEPLARSNEELYSLLIPDTESTHDASSILEANPQLQAVFAENMKLIEMITALQSLNSKIEHSLLQSSKRA